MLLVIIIVILVLKILVFALRYVETCSVGFIFLHFGNISKLYNVLSGRPIADAYGNI